MSITTNSDGSVYSCNCKVSVPAEEQNGSRPAGQFSSYKKSLHSEMGAMREQLVKLTTQAAKIDSVLDSKKTVTYLKQSVEYISANYGRVLADLSKQYREIADIRTRLAYLENSASKREVLQLRRQVNDLEHRAPSQNLEIHGTSHSKEGCLLDIVNALAQDLSLPLLTEEDVDCAQGLQSKPNHVTPTPGRFVSRRRKRNEQEKRTEM